MSDRLREAIEAVLDALQPRLKYFALWEYRVVVVSPGPPVKIDARSTIDDMPDLAGIELWPGPSGAIAVPMIGSRVRVGFINGDPARPAIFGLDPESSPTLTMLGGAVGPFVARIGDSVLVTGVRLGSDTATGTITSGSVKVQST